MGTADDEGIYRVYDAKIIEKASADPRQGELEELSTDHTTGAFDVILESLLDGVKNSGGCFVSCSEGWATVWEWLRRNGRAPRSRWRSNHSLLPGFPRARSSSFRPLTLQSMSLIVISGVFVPITGDPSSSEDAATAGGRPSFFLQANRTPVHPPVLIFRTHAGMNCSAHREPFITQGLPF